LKVNGPIYSPALKANMPIFEAVPHFIEPVRCSESVARGPLAPPGRPARKPDAAV
jgi:hypothetical protein